MIIDIREHLNHIEEGEYTGKILSQSEGVEGEYLWLNIKVDHLDCILNVSIHIHSRTLNDFCREIAKDLGEFDTANLVGRSIKFTVYDKKYSDSVYSKIKSIHLYDLFADEEVV